MATIATVLFGSWLLTLLPNIPLANAGTSLNPVTNFCRRVGHSSVVKNGTLFINGGLETYVDFGANGAQNTKTITAGINSDLIKVNMSASWDWQQNVTITHSGKGMSGSVNGFPVPLNIQNGAFFGGRPDSTTMWQFGGTTAGLNKSYPWYEIPADMQYAAWMYDNTSGLWTAYDTSTFGISIPSWGANAEAPHLGLGFYMGGQVDNGTANSTQTLPSPVGISDMIVLDTDHGQFYNISVDKSVQSNRQGAGMIYVDTFGTNGVLVMVGGQTIDSGLLPMDQIAIMDVSTLNTSQSQVSDGKYNTWYTQKASGDIPSPRTDFCLVAAPALDNSSSNIYLYGGKSNGSIFDDVYVLSLPSFTWVKVFTGSDARWSVTCHFVAPRHMITVGGGGKSSNISSDCDWESKSLAVLDLSTIGWSSKYISDAPAYVLPSQVVSAIGGKQTGGATKTAPGGGFAATGLAKVFSIKASSTTNDNSTLTNGTTTITTSAIHTPTVITGASLSGGAIAGIVIGALALIGGIVGLIVFLILRKRRSKHSNHLELPSRNSPEVSEMTGDRPPHYRAGGSELPSNEAAAVEKDHDYKPSGLESGTVSSTSELPSGEITEHKKLHIADMVKGPVPGRVELE